MPRKGKNESKLSRREPTQADVTLEDFANAKKTAHRLRKSAANSINREVNECSTLTYNDEWDESDSENEERVTSLRHAKTRRRRCRSSTSVDDWSDGQTYPVDIWFLLGQFIQPEDVKVFASICKTSYYVTSTYKFWISLYKRYYSPSMKMPDHLQPLQIDRPNCIKANVVRALYYIYPLFAKRTNRPNMHITANPSDAASNLVKLVCSAVWHFQNAERKWNFFFKFETCKTKKSFKNFRVLPSLEFDEDDWEKDNLDWDTTFRSSGIVFNPDEGFCILRITCNHFVDIPATVMGTRLAEFKTSLSRDLRGHQIQLFFTPNIYECNKKQTQSVSTRVDFNPADSVNVLHWWDPEFPRAKSVDPAICDVL